MDTELHDGESEIEYFFLFSRGGGDYTVRRCVRLDRQIFNQADSQRLVVLLRGERVSACMSLVWLTMSKALVRSISMVDVRSGGQGRLKH